MSLQFMIGGSGTGKSHYAYQNIIREAMRCPDVLYYIVVPEQFTLKTQREVVAMTPGKGILNIDVLSLTRLAYRVFEETGGDTLSMLDDMGKSMVLRRLIEEDSSAYPYLGSQMRRPGCLDEVKSLISEFMQYDISPEEAASMAETAGNDSLLNMKLKDVSLLYERFDDYLTDRYMTSEGVMEELQKAIPASKKLKGSVILLDGFTGFTPVQLLAVRELLAVCSHMTVTVTMDKDEYLSGRDHPWSLFSMSRRMIRQLSDLTKDIKPPVLLGHNDHTRFREAASLSFLEKNIFRYTRKQFGEKTDNLRIISARNPLAEMEEAARIICEKVRTEGLKYGEIAVVCGDLASYAPAAREAFERAGIPCFIDETHSILQNPFVEYLRACMEIVESNYSYESVFRYLRCGFSGITQEEADRLENYVRALGIRGFSGWNKKWVRLSRGMDPAEISLLNEIRERFVNETISLKEGLSGKKTVREYCTSLYLFFRENSIQEKLKEREEQFGEAGERTLEKEYAQIYRIVIDLFDRMTEILGDEVLTRKDFTKVLETGLSKAKVAVIPPGQDQVLVGDMERTRLKDIKALFFVGVNEGNIPKAPSAGGILSESDRDFLADRGITLAPDPKEQMAQQRFYLYLNLTKPSAFLCLSYSATNQKGEALMPSYLIGMIRSMFPEITAESAEENFAGRLPEKPSLGLYTLIRELKKGDDPAEDPLITELCRWYREDEYYSGEFRKIIEAAYMRSPQGHIGSTVAKALWGDVNTGSATRLERFASCACAHFMRYGLMLSPREDYEFRSSDMGTLIHKALEEYTRELKREGLSLRTVTEEKEEEILARCLAELTADYGNSILKSSARNEWMADRAGKILRRTIWALKQQVVSGKFDPEGAEIAFDGGRIDRLDTMEEEDRVYVKVIDYKTGNTSFELLKLYHGLQVQLALYLDAAMKIEKKKHPDSEVIPAGIFYYNVKDQTIDGLLEDEPEEIKEEIMKSLKMNGLCSDDPEIIRAMDCTTLSLPVNLSVKDGQVTGNTRGNTANPEQFGIMTEYVREMTQENLQRMLSGETKARPYRMKKSTACDYCDFRDACGFDPALPGYSYKEIRKLDNAELWRRMAEAVDEKRQEE